MGSTKETMRLGTPNSVMRLRASGSAASEEVVEKEIASPAEAQPFLGQPGVLWLHVQGLGNEALVTVAERLRTSVRGSDTVARYGGDEFVVIAADLDRAADASNIAEKIADMVGLPVPLEGGPWRGGCSIGISVYPDDSTEPVTLLALADKAMYGVKASAESRYAYFAAA